MAAPPQMPNTPLLTRYREDEQTNENTRQPSGPCNYINLSIGGDAKCGCRRFTELHGVGGQTPSDLCFCEHHSCFHDYYSVDELRILPEVSSTGGMALTPKSLISRKSPIPKDHDMQDEQPEVVPRQKGEPLPNELHWKNFIKSGSSLRSFPAIPSQCLLPSDDGSRASSSQPGSMRPFAGLGLNTLTNIPQAASDLSIPLKEYHPPGNERQVQFYKDSHGNPCFQSLTEVATPSLQSSQNMDDGITFGRNLVKVQNALQRIIEEKSQGNMISQMVSRPEKSSWTESHSGLHTTVAQREETDENLLPRIRSIINCVADYPLKIQNHEERLDHLENASFTHPALDEIQETNGDLDIRVGQLETKVDDLEKARLAQSDTGSFTDDSRMSSTSSGLIASAINQVDYARIEALEAHVAELQAIAPPSHNHPWEFEIVFLPFGSRLNGIWSSNHPVTQRSRVNSTAGADGTQTQCNSLAVNQACLAAHDQGVAWESSMNKLNYQRDPWLMPKACGLRSRIGERLRSRGLVRSIQIKGPDVRDIQASILDAFGDLPSKLAEDPFSHHSRDHQAIPLSLTNYLGLHASWIPLRKLHKDDKLRFLNTSEMITPALWTMHFLSSSVAMRAGGIRRLYVTHSDSYLQHLRNESAEWTWQKLRQLPRVYPEFQSGFDHTPEADAHEPCWEYDERLDPPPSILSTFVSNHSVLSIRPGSHEQEIEVASASEHSSTPVSPVASTTPTSIGPPQWPPHSTLKERPLPRPLHTRTNSMPSMPSLVPVKSSPSLTKRRIASLQLESQTTPTRAVPLALKRRRISRSPSRPRDTPRWSVGPPSPYTFAEDVVERHKRGTTPFAYATPHSNAPYFEASRHVHNDDDGEGSATDEIEEGYDRHALSDYDSDEASNVGNQPDEEWEGVQEDESRNINTLSARAIGGQQDDNNIENDVEDMASEASSSPSEYPSRQPEGMYSETMADFKIHVDEEVEDAY